MKSDTMYRLRAFCAGAGLLMLSACNQAPQISNQTLLNDAEASDQAIEDADTRAERLADQAALLNSEAAAVSGARRSALENRARADLSEATTVEQQGETDADDIANATEAELGDARRH